MISLQGVSIELGGRQILSDISFDLPTGSHLCLIGRSGAGKSVLTKLILGLLPLQAGEIWLDDRSVRTLDRVGWQELLGEVGVVFQQAALFDSLSVLENIGIKLYEGREWEAGEIEARAVVALEQVQLSPDLLHRYPASLSGGMQKRVGIARALIHQPKYLVFDEPTSGLDPISAEAIDELIINLIQDEARTTLVVTHDMHSVKRLATHVAMIHDGGLGFFGTQADFFASSREEVQHFLRRMQAG
jgi:phospholipid/cholesterol/gamma-HCH transport system ATP-binding protein